MKMKWWMKMKGWIQMKGKCITKCFTPTSSFKFVSIQIQYSLCILSMYRSDTTRSRTQCSTFNNNTLVCINPDTTLSVFSVCINPDTTLSVFSVSIKPDTNSVLVSIY